MPMKLFALAEKEGIKIEWWDFKPPLEAVYWYRPGLPPIIGLSHTLQSAPRSYFRCVLAEEIGHFYTTIGAIHIPRTLPRYHQRTNIGIYEYRARRWAAEHLIPLPDLIRAFKEGVTYRWELAEYFDVTEEMVDFRLRLPDLVTVRYAC
ncbi:ImmA/IrrE family metallo-endopeptidase [Thermanaeromonas toyohensis]|nr:ImmA/IrrE family metallo-endopeptidase [Thermanaeromonas toyohensis]